MQQWRMDCVLKAPLSRLSQRHGERWDNMPLRLKCQKCKKGGTRGDRFRDDVIAGAHLECWLER